MSMSPATRRFQLPRLFLGAYVSVTGCADQQPCVETRVLDPNICQMLPSGWVVQSAVDGVMVSRLLDDGSLEVVADLPVVGCFEPIEYDAEQQKAWWIETGDNEVAPSRLYQFDVAAGTVEWQRDLVHEDLRMFGSGADLLWYGGALYVGGSGAPAPYDPSVDSTSMVLRLDADGEPAWTQIGYPGVEGAEEWGPLNGVRGLMGTAGTVSFVGYWYGTDSQTTISTTVDAGTGELLWSASLDEDTYFGVSGLASDDEFLYVLLGSPGYNDVEDARTTLAKLTPLGAEQWQTSEFVWSGFTGASISHAVVGEDIFTAATMDDPESRARITRRSSTGSRQCESDVSGIEELGAHQIELLSVGDKLIAKLELDEETWSTVFVLLKPVG